MPAYMPASAWYGTVRYGWVMVRYGQKGSVRGKRNFQKKLEFEAVQTSLAFVTTETMKKPNPIDPTVSALAALLGKRGGSKRSPKQKASAMRNVMAAQAARRKKAA